MMVFKRKQIIVLSLVLMIIVAGYLQYSYRRSSTATAGKNEGKLGEAVYVSENEDGLESNVSNEKAAAQKIAPASKAANNFFAQSKMDKESALSSSKEALEKISKDANASKETKAEAYDKMMALIENSKREANIETLIKKIGFSDVIVLFGEDGSVDIIVKTPSLSPSQVAQITDITSRQAKVALDMVHIKSMY